MNLFTRLLVLVLVLVLVNKNDDDDDSGDDDESFIKILGLSSSIQQVVQSRVLLLFFSLLFSKNSFRFRIVFVNTIFLVSDASEFHKLFHAEHKINITIGMSRGGWGGCLSNESGLRL